MHEEATAIRGMEAAVAVWRLLQISGVDMPLMEFKDIWPMDETVESMRLPLESHGMLSRAVKVDVGDCAHLPLPSLLQLKDRTWIVLRARTRKHRTVEDAGGLVRVSSKDLDQQLYGGALELLSRIPGGATVWRRLGALLLSHWRSLVYFVLASVLIQALALLTPELTSQVIGRALPDGATQLLRLLATLVVLAALLMGGIAWLRERVVLYVLTQLETTLKRGLLNHVLRLPFVELERRTLGDLLQSFSGITAARTLFGERALTALFDGVLAISFLLVMGAKLLAPTLALMFAALLMALVAWVVGRTQSRLQTREVTAQASQRGYIVELISGIGTVKAAGAEQECHGQWMKRFRRELQFTLERQRVGLWSEVGIETIRQASSVSMLLWGGLGVLNGEIGIGPLFGFLMLAEGFLLASTGMINAYLILVVIRPQLDRSQELLALQPMPPRRPRYAARSSGPIVMSDVWFRYSAEAPWVLKGYNLRVEPGEKLMLEGPSGFGKSTILRLIAGLYRPESGSVRVGGCDPTVDPQSVLYLPQFMQLYGGSIMENLRMLSGGVDTQRLLEAAQLTGFHSVVASLAMQYQTILPHGGRTLSGGQRQMLALTAMVAADRQVLLLDEPMANIDPLTQVSLHAILSARDATIITAGHA